MEKTEACAILGVPIEASRSEVEAAFHKRMREVRARFDAALGMRLRAKCRREFDAILEAQDCLLRELAERPPKQAAVEEPRADVPKVDEPQAHEPVVDEQKVDEPKVDDSQQDEPRVDELKVDEPKVDEPKVDEPRADERPTEAPRAADQPVTLLGEDHTGKSPQPTVSVPDQLSPGRLFVSRFELQRELEIGSTGAVWLTQDHFSQRQVVLIFLPGLISSGQAAIEDLRNEIRRRAALNHSNIMRIFDLVEDKGRVAIEIEYLAGRSLSELRFGMPNHVFEVGDLKTWVKELCEALQYAHGEAGLIHGNIQPGNLIVDGAGSLKVKDFGISNCIHESISRLTRTPKTCEALQYRSPQQAAGEKAAIADDLYSLGATLYELLTSKPPFSSREIALQVSAKEPPAMTARRAEFGIEGEDIPKNWEETVAACLAKDPNQRPQSAIEVARRLENAIPQSDIPTPPAPAPAPLPPPLPPPPPPPAPPPAPAPAPALAIAGIIFLLVIVSGIGFFAFQYLTEPKVGKIAVKTRPPHANVFVDGVDRGKTPLDLEDVAPGDRKLSIELKGYEPLRLIVHVKRGYQVRLPLISLVQVQNPSSRPKVAQPSSRSDGENPSLSVATPSPAANPAPSLEYKEPDYSKFKVEEGPITLEFWSWVDGLDKVAKQFEKAYPTIKVTVNNVGKTGEEYQKLQSVLKDGSGAPDLVEIEFDDLPLLIFKDVLVDMAQYGANEAKPYFVPWTWGQVSPDGNAVFGIPQDSGPFALIYNKKIFDQYALAVPTTWDEYAEQAEKLDRATGGKVKMGYFYATDATWFIGLAWASGGEFFKKEGDTWIQTLFAGQNLVQIYSDATKAVSVHCAWPPWLDLVKNNFNNQVEALFSGVMTPKQALDAWQKECLQNAKASGYKVKGQ